jgi:DNA adenine methylase
MTRPFLKWAGGKYKVLPKLKEYLPKGKRLVEPFVGAGSVFLNVEYDHYFLADANADLINLFNLLKKQGPDFIRFCQQYFRPETNQEEAFYALRNEFNETKDKKLRSALFLYLNKHGYNGLCRYNASGEFNVPFGKYKNPPLFPIDCMKFFLEQIKNATFVRKDFLATMQEAQKGDVVYCDPPYVPLSDTAYFTAYSALCFDEGKQVLLAETARETAARGVPVLISNHDTPLTRKLYKGAKIYSFKVGRSISSKTDKRFPVKEIIAVF